MVGDVTQNRAGPRRWQPNSGAVKCRSQRPPRRDAKRWLMTEKEWAGRGLAVQARL